MSAPKFDDLPCVHRGAYLKTLACCGDVHQCRKHASRRCTAGGNSVGVGMCQGCAAREAPAEGEAATRTVYLDADRHGIGDAVSTAWIAEGAKGGTVRLVHRATGQHRQLLEMLGQEVVDAIPAGAETVDTHATYHDDEVRAEGGAVARPASRGRGIGILTEPKAPPVSIEPQYEAWAAEHAPEGVPLVLLYPQTHYRSRQWPANRWVELAWRLQVGGLAPRLMLYPDDDQYHNTPGYLFGVDVQASAALMRRAAATVGNDSGPLHVAATVGATAIGVLGPTNPEVFANYGPNVRLLRAESVPCVGCHFRIPFRAACDRGCFALDAVSVGQVYNAVMEAVHPEWEVDGGTGLFRRRDTLGGQDCDVLREVVHGDCYGLRGLPRWGEETFVVDVGGHIGSFVRTLAALQPRARVVSIEACPENYAILSANCGQVDGAMTAKAMHAAVCYRKGPVRLLNSILDGGTATGGSRVVTDEEVAAAEWGHQYRLDERKIVRTTLEAVMAAHGKKRIDLLKLDCEGSEFDILEHSAAVRDGAVSVIVGEYHGEERFRRLVAERFAEGWDVTVRPPGGGSIGYFEMRRKP
jgi:FkbM family methyltransferase